MKRALALVWMLTACSSEATTQKAPSESAEVAEGSKPKLKLNLKSRKKDMLAARGAQGGAKDSVAATSAVPSPHSPTAAPSAVAPPAWPPAGTVAVAGGTLQAHDLNDHLHPITVEPFAIDAQEVTVAQYRTCVAAGKCKAPEDISLNKGGCSYPRTDREAHPINCVGPTHAQEYCTSVGKRLPSAAEWQMAASAGGTRKYPWGDAAPTKETVCWRSTDATCPVGTHSGGSTPDGIHDLAGNVAEIVADPGCIGKPPGGTPCRQPVVFTSGGAWNTFESDGLLAQNLGQTLGRPPESVGFRCVSSRSATPPILIPPS